MPGVRRLKVNINDSTVGKPMLEDIVLHLSPA